MLNFLLNSWNPLVTHGCRLPCLKVRPEGVIFIFFLYLKKQSGSTLRPKILFFIVFFSDFGDFLLSLIAFLEWSWFSCGIWWHFSKLSCFRTDTFGFRIGFRTDLTASLKSPPPPPGAQRGEEPYMAALKRAPPRAQTGSKVLQGGPDSPPRGAKGNNPKERPWPPPPPGVQGSRSFKIIDFIIILLYFFQTYMFFVWKFNIFQ